LIDAANGGSALAYPQTLAKVLTGVRNVDTLISGHATTTSGTGQQATFVRSAPVRPWTDLREYADFMRDFVAAGQAAKKAGKSVDAAVKELKMPDRYTGYNLDRAREDSQRVYDATR